MALGLTWSRAETLAGLQLPFEKSEIDWEETMGVVRCRRSLIAGRGGLPLWRYLVDG